MAHLWKCSQRFFVDMGGSTGERAAICTEPLPKEKGDEGAELDIYSTIFGADEEKSESFGDGRKLRVREVTLPCSAIPDGTTHSPAPASLGQEEIIALNSFFTAARPEVLCVQT